MNGHLWTFGLTGSACSSNEHAGEYYKSTVRITQLAGLGLRGSDPKLNEAAPGT